MSSQAYDLACVRELIQSPNVEARFDVLVALLRKARTETAYLQMEHDCGVARRFANNGEAVAKAIHEEWLRHPTA